MALVHTLGSSLAMPQSKMRACAARRAHHHACRVRGMCPYKCIVNAMERTLLVVPANAGRQAQCRSMPYAPFKNIVINDQALPITSVCVCMCVNAISYSVTSLYRSHGIITALPPPFLPLQSLQPLVVAVVAVVALIRRRSPVFTCTAQLRPS